jgi:CRISPR/Cas system CSM-associated protein Csm3 (group 7 of RAMP superfamily)
MADPGASPYNFVPLPGEPPRRQRLRGHHRVDEGGLSGALVCELEAVTALFTADHAHATRADTPQRQEVFPFLRDSSGRPIVQGTTLKGMVRAVYEALTNSCLPLTDTRGRSKRSGVDTTYLFADLGDHDPKRCSDPDHLCPACRLFGVVQGEEVHALGRVAFSNAVLCAGDLVRGEVRLPELHSPKQHHYPIYSRSGEEEGAIAGRKFYYHHDPGGGLEAHDPWGKHAKGLAELAPAGARFGFEVRLQNLSGDELRALLCCLVLGEGLAHKVGMAKPLGYGSCTIHLDEQRSVVVRGAAAYRTWRRGREGVDLAAERTSAGDLLTAAQPLRKLLSTGSQDGRTVGYPDYGTYRGQRVEIESTGRYRLRPKGGGEGSGGQAGAAVRPGTFSVSALAKPAAKDRKKRGTGPPQAGDRVPVEVLSSDESGYRLRVKATGQELRYEGQVRWREGQRLKVLVVKVDPEGRILEVRP